MRIRLFTYLFVVSLFVSACSIYCDDDYRVAGILLNYENYQDETKVSVYALMEENDSLVYEIEVVDLYEHSYHLNIENNYDELIVILGDSVRIDTFSEFSISRYGKCDNSIDVKYTHNGEFKESSEVIFD